MPWTPWIRIVEADAIPRVRVSGQAFHPVEDGTTELIGLSDPRGVRERSRGATAIPAHRFVAYVPAGAIEISNQYVLTYTAAIVPQADGGRLRIQSKRARRHRPRT